MKFFKFYSIFFVINFVLLSTSIVQAHDYYQLYSMSTFSNEKNIVYKTNIPKHNTHNTVTRYKIIFLGVKGVKGWLELVTSSSTTKKHESRFISFSSEPIVVSMEGHIDIKKSHLILGSSSRKHTLSVIIIPEDLVMKVSNDDSWSDENLFSKHDFAMKVLTSNDDEAIQLIEYMNFLVFPEYEIIYHSILKDISHHIVDHIVEVKSVFVESVIDQIHNLKSLLRYLEMQHDDKAISNVFIGLNKTKGDYSSEREAIKYRMKGIKSVGSIDSYNKNKLRDFLHAFIKKEFSIENNTSYSTSTKTTQAEDSIYPTTRLISNDIATSSLVTDNAQLIASAATTSVSPVESSYMSSYHTQNTIQSTNAIPTTVFPMSRAVLNSTVFPKTTDSIITQSTQTYIQPTVSVKPTSSKKAISSSAILPMPNLSSVNSTMVSNGNSTINPITGFGENVVLSKFKSLLNKSIDSTHIAMLANNIQIYNKEPLSKEILNWIHLVNQAQGYLKVISWFTSYAESIRHHDPIKAKKYEAKVDELVNLVSKRLEDRDKESAGSLENTNKKTRHRRSPYVWVSPWKFGDVLKDLGNFLMGDIGFVEYVQGFEMMRESFLDDVHLYTVKTDEFVLMSKREKMTKDQKVEELKKINDEIFDKLVVGEYEAVGKLSFQVNLLLAALGIKSKTLEQGRKVTEVTEMFKEIYRYIYSKIKFLGSFPLDENKVVSYALITKYALGADALYSGLMYQHNEAGLCYANSVTIALSYQHDSAVVNLQNLVGSTLGPNTMYSKAYLRTILALQYLLNPSTATNSLYDRSLSLKRGFYRYYVNKVMQLHDHNITYGSLKMTSLDTMVEFLTKKLSDAMNLPRKTVGLKVGTYVLIPGHIMYVSMSKLFGGRYVLDLFDSNLGLIRVTSRSFSKFQEQVKKPVYNSENMWEYIVRKYPESQGKVYLSDIHSDLLKEVGNLQLLPDSCLTVKDVVTNPIKDLAYVDSLRISDFIKTYFNIVSTEENIKLLALKETDSSLLIKEDDQVGLSDSVFMQMREVIAAVNQAKDKGQLLPPRIRVIHNHVMELSKKVYAKIKGLQEKTEAGEEKAAKVLEKIKGLSGKPLSAVTDSKNSFELLKFAFNEDVVNTLNPSLTDSWMKSFEEIVSTDSDQKSGLKTGEKVGIAVGSIAGVSAAVGASALAKIVSSSSSSSGYAAVEQELEERASQRIARRVAKKIADKAAAKAAEKAEEEAVDNLPDVPETEPGEADNLPDASETEELIPEQRAVRCGRSVDSCAQREMEDLLEEMAEDAVKEKSAEELGEGGIASISGGVLGFAVFYSSHHSSSHHSHKHSKPKTTSKPASKSKHKEKKNKGKSDKKTTAAPTTLTAANNSTMAAPIMLPTTLTAANNSTTAVPTMASTTLTATENNSTMVAPTMVPTTLTAANNSTTAVPTMVPTTLTAVNNSTTAVPTMASTTLTATANNSTMAAPTMVPTTLTAVNNSTTAVPTMASTTLTATANNSTMAAPTMVPTTLTATANNSTTAEPTMASTTLTATANNSTTAVPTMASTTLTATANNSTTAVLTMASTTLTAANNSTTAVPTMAPTTLTATANNSTTAVPTMLPTTLTAANNSTTAVPTMVPTTLTAANNSTTAVPTMASTTLTAANNSTINPVTWLASLTQFNNEIENAVYGYKLFMSTLKVQAKKQSVETQENLQVQALDEFKQILIPLVLKYQEVLIETQEYNNLKKMLTHAIQQMFNIYVSLPIDLPSINALLIAEQLTHDQIKSVEAQLKNKSMKILILNSWKKINQAPSKIEKKYHKYKEIIDRYTKDLDKVSDDYQVELKYLKIHVLKPITNDLLDSYLTPL